MTDTEALAEALSALRCLFAVRQTGEGAIRVSDAATAQFRAVVEAALRAAEARRERDETEKRHIASRVVAAEAEAEQAKRERDNAVLNLTNIAEAQQARADAAEARINALEGGYDAAPDKH